MAYYFGVFNPFHQGHLAVAKTAQQQLGFDKIIFVPSNSPPHKNTPNNNFKSRCAELSTELLPYASWAAISTIEGELPQPNYTLNTLKKLIPNFDTHQQDIPYILGADSFLSLPSWHQPEVLYEKLFFIVAPRNHLKIQAPSPNIKYTILDMEPVDQSSSALRKNDSTK